MEYTRITDKQLFAYIENYENQHGFNSDKLIEMLKSGNAPDTIDIHMWTDLLSIAYNNEYQGYVIFSW